MIELQVYRDGKREGQVKINLDFFELQDGLTVPVGDELGVIRFKGKWGYVVEIIHN